MSAEPVTVRNPVLAMPPPASNTVPSDSNVAVCASRGEPMVLAIAVNVPLVGS